MEKIRDMDALIIAVAHDAFLKLDREQIDACYQTSHKRKVLMDIKGVLDRKVFQSEDYWYWRL